MKWCSSRDDSIEIVTNHTFHCAVNLDMWDRHIFDWQHKIYIGIEKFVIMSSNIPNPVPHHKHIFNLSEITDCSVFAEVTVIQRLWIKTAQIGWRWFRKSIKSWKEYLLSIISIFLKTLHKLARDDLENL